MVEFVPSHAMTDKKFFADFVLLGMQGEFTFHVLSTLLDSACLPEKIFLYGQQKKSISPDIHGIKVEVKHSETPILSLIRQFSIPVSFVRHDELSNHLKGMSFDYLVTACWPLLIPENVLSQAGKAALNIHPSLLPLYKGLNPVRDQLTAKDERFGVTLHHMNNNYDSGEIEIQQAIQNMVNPNIEDIEKACAKSGARLLIKVLGDSA